MLSDQLDVNTIGNHDLTICDFLDGLKAPILKSFMKYFYAEENCTKNLILDMRDVTGERLTTNDIYITLSQLNGISKKRKNGKTALIVNNALDRMLAIVSMNMAENQNYPIEFSMFTSRDEALKWMNVELDINEIEPEKEKECV